jgi:hypothetical protein
MEMRRRKKKKKCFEENFERGMKVMGENQRWTIDVKIN